MSQTEENQGSNLFPLGRGAQKETNEAPKLELEGAKSLQEICDMEEEQMGTATAEKKLARSLKTALIQTPLTEQNLECIRICAHKIETKIHHLERDISNNQKIIKNLTMLLSTLQMQLDGNVCTEDKITSDQKQLIDNELITSYEVDLEAERRRTGNYKLKYNVNPELLRNFMLIINSSSGSNVDNQDLCSMSEIAEEENDEMQVLKALLLAQHEILMELKKDCLQAEEDMQVKDERIHALEEELFVLTEEACRTPDTDVSVQTEGDLDDEKKKNDKEIEGLMNEKDSEIRALKNELELATRPKSTAATVTQMSVNMADLDADGVQLIRARDEVLRLGNALAEKDEHITEYESELHSQGEQERDAAMIKIRRNSLQTKLHNDRHKTDLIDTEINLLECQAMKTDKDAVELEIKNLQSLREEVAALGEQSDNVITERNQLTQERDHLIFESKRQAAEIEAMQKDSDALNHETEDLQGQCNNVAALKKQLKTVTTEQQRLKKVGDKMQLAVEHLRSQYKNVAALKEQLNIATVQHPKLRKGRRAFVVIITMLILCFSVGLLLTPSNSLNIYEMPIISLCNTSSSHNRFITVTARRSYNIIV